MVCVLMAIGAAQTWQALAVRTTHDILKVKMTIVPLTWSISHNVAVHAARILKDCRNFSERRDAALLLRRAGSLGKQQRVRHLRTGRQQQRKNHAHTKRNCNKPSSPRDACPTCIPFREFHDLTLADSAAR